MAAGYRANSPDRFNPYNIIPGTPQGTNITMDGVPPGMDILGIDNLGNKQIMTEGNYNFPGSSVFEVPMNTIDNGTWRQRHLLNRILRLQERRCKGPKCELSRDIATGNDRLGDKINKLQKRLQKVNKTVRGRERTRKQKKRDIPKEWEKLRQQAIKAKRKTNRKYGGTLPKDVHNAADRAGIKWDNNEDFMNMSNNLVGKEHIDDMTSEERDIVINSMEYGGSLPSYQKTTQELPNIPFLQRRTTTGDNISPHLEAEDPTAFLQAWTKKTKKTKKEPSIFEEIANKWPLLEEYWTLAQEVADEGDTASHDWARLSAIIAMSKEGTDDEKYVEGTGIRERKQDAYRHAYTTSRLAEEIAKKRGNEAPSFLDKSMAFGASLKPEIEAIGKLHDEFPESKWYDLPLGFFTDLENNFRGAFQLTPDEAKKQAIAGKLAMEPLYLDDSPPTNYREGQQKIFTPPIKKRGGSLPSYQSSYGSINKFYSDYLQSPTYKERLVKQGYEDPDKTIAKAKPKPKKEVLSKPIETREEVYKGEGRRIYSGKSILHKAENKKGLEWTKKLEEFYKKGYFEKIRISDLDPSDPRRKWEESGDFDVIYAMIGDRWPEEVMEYKRKNTGYGIGDTNYTLDLPIENAIQYVKGTPGQAQHWRWKAGTKWPIKKHEYDRLKGIGEIEVLEDIEYKHGGSLPKYQASNMGFDFSNTGTKGEVTVTQGKEDFQREDFSGNLLSYGIEPAALMLGYLGDLSRYYAGQKLKDNILSESLYKPTVAKNKNAKYVAINDDRWKEWVLKYASNYPNEERITRTAGTGPKGQNWFEYALEDNALGNFDITRGKDKKGQYLSYYDIYDIYTGGKPNLDEPESLGAVKPYEIYDRIYYTEDPKTGKYTLQKRKGGSLPSYQSSSTSTSSATIGSAYNYGWDTGTTSTPLTDPVALKEIEIQKQKEADWQNQLIKEQLLKEGKIGYEEVYASGAVEGMYGLNDPILNALLLGAPASLGIGAKAGSKLKGLGKLADIVNPLSGFKGPIQYPAQNMRSLKQETLGHIKKGQSTKKAVKEGNEWLKNWIQHPTTQAKVEKNLSKAASDYNDDLLKAFNSQKKRYAEINKDHPNFTPLSISTIKPTLLYPAPHIKRLQQYTPDVSVYPLKRKYKDFFTGKGVDENYGVSYRHHLGSSKTNQPNIENKLTEGTWVGTKARRPESTTIHEGTHDWMTDQALTNTGGRRLIKNAQTPYAKKKTSEFLQSGNDYKKHFEGYLANPTEVHARIMELRRAFNLSPDDIVTSKDIAKMIKINKDQFYRTNPQVNIVSPKFFDQFKKIPRSVKSREEIKAQIGGLWSGSGKIELQNPANPYGFLANLFNKLGVSTGGVVGVGALANQNKEYKKGGSLPSYQRALTPISQEQLLENASYGIQPGSLHPSVTGITSYPETTFASGRADYIPLEVLALPGTPLIKGVGKLGNIILDFANPLAGVGKNFIKAGAGVKKNIKDKAAKALEKEGNLEKLNKIAEVASKNPATKKLYKDYAFKIASKSGVSQRSGKEIVSTLMSGPKTALSDIGYVGNIRGGSWRNKLGGKEIKRNLIQEYIYGNSPGFIKSNIKHKGLEKYTKRYGDLKTYKLDDSVWGKGPLTMSGKPVSNKGRFRPNQHQSGDYLGTNLTSKLDYHINYKPDDKYSKILNEALKGFKPGSKGYYKKLGETIKKHKKITISAEDGLLGADDIGGHLITLKHTPKKGFQVETQDIWKFTPEDFGPKWGGPKSFKAHGQAALMDKAGKPFVMNDVRPLFLKKKGGPLPSYQSPSGELMAYKTRKKLVQRFKKGGTLPSSQNQETMARKKQKKRNIPRYQSSGEALAPWATAGLGNNAMYDVGLQDSGYDFDATPYADTLGSQGGGGGGLGKWMGILDSVIGAGTSMYAASKLKDQVKQPQPKIPYMDLYRDQQAMLEGNRPKSTYGTDYPTASALGFIPSSELYAEKGGNLPMYQSTGQEFQTDPQTFYGQGNLNFDPLGFTNNPGISRPQKSVTVGPRTQNEFWGNWKDHDWGTDADIAQQDPGNRIAPGSFGRDMKFAYEDDSNKPQPGERSYGMDASRFDWGNLPTYEPSYTDPDPNQNDYTIPSAFGPMVQKGGYLPEYKSSPYNISSVTNRGLLNGNENFNSYTRSQEVNNPENIARMYTREGTENPYFNYFSGRSGNEIQTGDAFSKPDSFMSNYLNTKIDAQTGNVPEYQKSSIHIKPENVGNLHTWAGISQGKTIPMSKKREAKNSSNPRVAAMGNFAVNANGWGTKEQGGHLIEPNAEIEDREVVEYTGKPAVATNGGSMTNLANNYQLASGATHEQGGIDVAAAGGFVFSDTLLLEGAEGGKELLESLKILT